MFYLHVCLCTSYVWCLQRTEEAIRSPGTKVKNSWELPRGYQDSNLGLLEKQPVPLTADPYLQLKCVVRVCMCMYIYTQICILCVCIIWLLYIYVCVCVWVYVYIHKYMVCMCVLRKDLTLYSPGWTGYIDQVSLKLTKICLLLPQSVGIKGMYYHAWLSYNF